MKLRTGRRNHKNLYIQLGDDPNHDDDFSVGYVEDPQIARWIVREANANPGSAARLESIIIEGKP